MRLSVSKVTEYEKCPYSYFLTNIKKEKWDVMPIQLKEGIEKHDMFEKAVILARCKNKDCTAIAQEIKRLPRYEQYKNDCNNFIKFCQEIEKKGGNPIPEFVELRMFNKDLNFAGIIDRVDYDDNSILILDYKTGKDHPIKEYYFQLAVYVHLFEQEHNKKVTHWGIFFSKSGKTVIEHIERKEVEKALERIKVVRNLIAFSIDTNEFPKQPSRLCDWCSWFQNKKCEGPCFNG